MFSIDAVGKIKITVLYVQYIHKSLVQMKKQSCIHHGMSRTDKRSSCGSGMHANACVHSTKL
jgi:hypothetical protein